MARRPSRACGIRSMNACAGSGVLSRPLGPRPAREGSRSPGLGEDRQRPRRENDCAGPPHGWGRDLGADRKERSMSDTDIDELGPVDYLVVEFPAGKSNFTGEMAAELASLVDSGIVRVLDLLILHKANDGTVEAFEIDDLDEVDELRALEGEIAEILAAE